MDTKLKLQMLLMHYEQTRGVGHTRALYDGLKPAIRLDRKEPTNVGVMTDSLNTAGRLFPFLYPKQWTSWGAFTEREAFRLRSRQYPLVLDNSAVIAILQDALNCIEKLEHRLDRLRKGEPEIEPPKLIAPTKEDVMVAMMLAKIEMNRAEREDREKLERLKQELNEE